MRVGFLRELGKRTGVLVVIKGVQLFLYKPQAHWFYWRRYRMSSGRMFLMMRFGFLGVNYYGN